MLQRVYFYVDMITQLRTANRNTHLLKAFLRYLSHYDFTRCKEAIGKWIARNIISRDNKDDFQAGGAGYK